MPTTDKQKTPVNFREFRKNLAGYLREARQGSHFVVTSRGEQVLGIMPPVAKAEQKRQLIGMFRGKFEIAPHFDEMTPDLIAAMESDNE
jgi:prevent-host-death family protein